MKNNIKAPNPMIQHLAMMQAQAQPGHTPMGVPKEIFALLGGGGGSPPPGGIPAPNDPPVGDPIFEAPPGGGGGGGGGGGETGGGGGGGGTGGGGGGMTIDPPDGTGNLVASIISRIPPDQRSLLIELASTLSARTGNHGGGAGSSVPGHQRYTNDGSAYGTGP